MVLSGLLALVLIGGGILAGWYISGNSSKNGIKDSSSVSKVKSSDTEAGIVDEKTFSDTAEGTLEEGGIEGEGTYHLVREGGPARYVYLTSTVIDLASFKGKKVKVWGQTLSGRKAGWLMDVGKIKVIE
ncbi:MAG: hypothetical protein AAB685_00635 [Patescibacteria group bacterium]